ELQHIRFRGHSDTEVVLEACAAWGVETAVKRMNGMFAFAVWDRQERKLSLVRDRLGIKPLYWGKFNNLLLFGSELKALKKHPGWRPVIDRTALAAFMQHRYIPAPRSIYENVYKLEPGHILTISPQNQIEDKVYWAINDIIQQGKSSQFQFSDEEAIDQLDTLLGDAVQRRMVADVPLGAFLSGGIDSSAVVAQMQKHGSQDALTFSIGFDDPKYNEAVYAKAVAQHLGSRHTELYVGPDQARDIIPALPTFYDEPFADSSQIPTFLVSQMTKKHVTVALSGDGGDELFAGYNRYQTARLIRHWTAPIKGPLRKALIAILTSLSPSGWNKLLYTFSKRCPGHKLYNFAAILKVDPACIYRELISEWNNPAALVIGAENPQGILWAAAKSQHLVDVVEEFQYLDTLNYLPDNILTKVDRASMAVSLEARTPILDHRIVEFAWRLPMTFKIRAKQRKWLLRQVAYKYIPRDLLERRKAGFKIPIDDWLKGSLRDWSESLLDKKRLSEEGFLNPVMVHERWNEHLSGQRNWKGSLWNVLMFQSWLEAQ
ncbi:MAG: asparagine synthase (glutamine-hydrolyzing), partial [Gammaproteobacteria bacterium]|nr:asparagine synthase (glutamine-hydrolyzing) [Gammaproteobacteria bacterium]